MKTKHISICLSIAVLTFTSCGDHSHGDQSHEHMKTETTGITEDQEAEAISLNNGEKWPVNEEMKPHVTQGETTLNDYITSKDTDYKSLASKLKDTDNELISSCTMEGESHDELHKWLHPHLELVSELADANDQTEADAVIQKLTNSYQNYHTYFQ